MRILIERRNSFTRVKKHSIYAPSYITMTPFQKIRFGVTWFFVVPFSSFMIMGAIGVLSMGGTLW